MREEVWKDIIGYEGLYQISNFGRVKSMPKNVICTNISTRTQKEKILKPDLMKKGYLRVCLSDKGRELRIMIHRLVYSHFKGPIPNGLVINHVDMNKQNNNDWNLELNTNRQNTHHFRKSIKRDLPIGVRRLRGKFQARLNISSKVIYLGVYTTPEEASLVFQQAIQKFNAF